MHTPDWEWSTKNQGKLEEAVAQFKKVIEIDPNFALAHNNLARVYSLKDNTAQAIEWLQKAIVFDVSLIDKSKMGSDFDNIRQSPEFQQLINSQ